MGLEDRATAMAAALSDVGALAGTDVADIGVGPGLADELRTLWSIRCLAEAALTRAVSRFHATGGCKADGAASTQAWLRGFLRMAPEAATRFVKVGAQLDNLPAVDKALSAGEISVEHAAPIAELVARVGPDAVAAGDGEQILLDLARDDSPTTVRAAAKYLHAHLCADDAVSDRKLSQRSRYLNVVRTFGGAVSIDGLLDSAGGEAVLVALQAATPAPCDGDDRTAEQRRADGLVDLCNRSLTTAPDVAGQRPHVTITLSYRELLAACMKPPGVRTDANIGGYVGDDPDEGGPLDAATARMAACDATIIPMVLGSDSMPLDVGRATRVISPALRRALVHRDRGCRFGGCDRPASWCDGHHWIHWAGGGETSLANLVLLCRHHHGLVHDGWQLVKQANGDVITHRPDGTPLRLVSKARRRPPMVGGMS